MFEIALAMAVGILGWSLAEYAIHRYAGHGPRATRNLFGKEHTAHHSRPHYFAAWWKKLLAATVATGLLLAPALLVAPPLIAIGFIVGFVGFYLFYELLHRLEHVWSGLGPYGKWARRHHFYHHFHNPRSNHGVTSPLWDLVFGTYQRVETVQVPRKLAMRWLCDPETGEVRSQFQSRYQLRGGPQRRDRPVSKSVAVATIRDSRAASESAPLSAS